MTTGVTFRGPTKIVLVFLVGIPLKEAQQGYPLKQEAPNVTDQQHRFGGNCVGVLVADELKCKGLPFSKTRIQSKETPRSCLGSFHVTELKPPYQIGSDLPVFTFCFGNLLVILVASWCPFVWFCFGRPPFVFLTLRATQKGKTGRHPNPNPPW